MRLFVRNMVCDRCKMAVEVVLREAGLDPIHIGLGEITLAAPVLSSAKRTEIASRLEELGFEILDDKREQQIAQIKALLISWIREEQEMPANKYSQRIAAALHHDYSSLSKLFSEVEGISIEQYYILQKIERVKELLIYDEKSLSQISDELGYSSVSHLSAQFKKVTGLNPSKFRQLGHQQRKSLDKI